MFDEQDIPRLDPIKTQRVCGARVMSEDDCRRCWDREIPEENDNAVPICNELKDVGIDTPEKLHTAIDILRGTPTIKDSGNRREFETGAVRDMQEGKGRCDLMPLEVVAAIMDDSVIDYIAAFQKTGNTNNLIRIFQMGIDDMFPNAATMLLEVAKHFEEGAKKYGENNWQKGIPVNCYIDSAVRHYIKWRRGDKDEPHNRAFVWNLMCCIWEVDYREKSDESNQ